MVRRAGPGGAAGGNCLGGTHHCEFATSAIFFANFTPLRLARHLSPRPPIHHHHHACVSLCTLPLLVDTIN